MIRTIQNELKVFLADLPEKGALWRYFRLWRNREFISETNHDEIVEKVLDDGRMTSRYTFMATMSCAIAILGLLLSSPAVVIGAMLISPLMGPIVSLGFSLCILDIKQLRKALEAIAIGFVLALAVSSLIVNISPITDPTPEILARTQPNLFDLLVAVFSGLAGGYAVIKNRGGAIVGVAIATALMPPLAVVGYGLSTGSGAIARGAFFLFMTNLLAISLSVTILAKWYGFGIQNSRQNTILQSISIFLAFVILSIPLGLSLKNIASQSYATKTIKAEIEDYFHFSSYRISNFSIAFKKNDEVDVDCILVTDSYAPGAQAEIEKNLSEALQKKVVLSLDQIILAKSEQKKIEDTVPVQNDTVLTNPVQAKPGMMNAQDDMTQAIENAVLFPLDAVNVDSKNDAVTIYPRPEKAVTFALLRRMEEELGRRFPDWSVRIVPPFQVLPYVYFDTGKQVPEGEELSKLDDIIWALKRWGVEEAAIIGYASTVGEFQNFNNTSLAYRRANSVVKHLEAAGIKAVTKAEYRTYNQRQEERAFGINSFQRVEIRPVNNSAPLPPTN